MPFFNALPRKLTLLPLSFFMVGWGVYVAGFVSLLNSWTTEEGMLFQQAYIAPNHYPYNTGQLSKIDLIPLPFYFTLVGGPFVALLGILNAALPGLASSIFGTLLAVLSAVHFACVGAATFICAAIIYNIDDHKSDPTSIKKMLAGMLLEGLCWCFVLTFAALYKYQPEEQGSDRPRRRVRCPFTPGVARILSIPYLVLAVVGWCVFSAGQYKFDKARCGPYESCYDYYPFYTSTAFIITPLLYLATLLHAGRANNIMGIFTSILGMVYLYFVGDSVNNAAIALQHCSHNRYDSCTPDDMTTLGLILGGGFISLFFWGCTFALWPFYRKHPPPADGGVSWSTNHQTSEPPPVYGTMQHYLETQSLIGRNMSMNM